MPSSDPSAVHFALTIRSIMPLGSQLYIFPLAYQWTSDKGCLYRSIYLVKVRTLVQKGLPIDTGESRLIKGLCWIIRVVRVGLSMVYRAGHKNYSERSTL
jgi:hypothetical protein